MRRRAIAGLVRQRLRDYPAVALVGPRQCGKTTLARTFTRRYFDLEQPAERLISRTPQPAVHGHRWSVDLATYLRRTKAR